jgi:hypothetical protein
MKNPDNIKKLNELTISYMMINGIKGFALEGDDPFISYYMSILQRMYMPLFVMSQDDKIEELPTIVPNSLLHKMVSKAFELYNSVDDLEDKIDPEIKQELSYALEGESKLYEYVSSSVSMYKEQLFDLLNNYNSKKDTYNDIKIKIYEDKMYEYAKSENYSKAAEIRDKINVIKDEIKKD